MPVGSPMVVGGFVLACVIRFVLSIIRDPELIIARYLLREKRV